jgi:hypothetical protein
VPIGCSPIRIAARSVSQTGSRLPSAKSSVVSASPIGIVTAIPSPLSTTEVRGIGQLARAVVEQQRRAGLADREIDIAKAIDEGGLSRWR